MRMMAELRFAEEIRHCAMTTINNNRGIFIAFHGPTSFSRKFIIVSIALGSPSITWFYLEASLSSLVAQAASQSTSHTRIYQYG
jgi:hypothetical protein